MDGITLASLVGVIGLGGSGIAVWVSLRERLVRAETLITVLEAAHKDHKSEVASLKEWLEGQFGDLRKGLDRKADR